MCYLPLLVVLPATIQSQSSSSQGSSDPKQQKGQFWKKRGGAGRKEGRPGIMGETSENGTQELKFKRKGFCKTVKLRGKNR